MKRKLFILLIATMGSAFKINAQDKTMMVTAGPEVIGAACTNCGLLVGAGATFDYGVLEKITVGAMFNYYLNKDVDGFVGWNESVMHVGGGASFYIKERFKGFYIGPDLGFISYKFDYGASETTRKNFTVGANLGWQINIADVVTINPHLGYGSWFEGTKGRINLGLRIGAKF